LGRGRKSWKVLYVNNVKLYQGVAMSDGIDTSQFWCWHEDCQDYGKGGAGNIVFKERYGKRNLALLKCNRQSGLTYPSSNIFP